MILFPAVPYEPSVWTQAIIGSYYLISDVRNKYYVPFDLTGEKVQIRLTKNIVEVFFNGGGVASHSRLSNPQHLGNILITTKITSLNGEFLYEKAKLENACDRMLAISSTPTIRNISTFLKNGKNQKIVESKKN